MSPNTIGKIPDGDSNAILYAERSATYPNHEMMIWSFPFGLPWGCRYAAVFGFWTGGVHWDGQGNSGADQGRRLQERRALPSQRSTR